MDHGEALGKLRDLLGPKGFIDAPEAVAPYAQDWRGIETGAPAAVLRPKGTDAVAACVRLCAAAGIPIVPQGGNTGLVGGTIARDGAVTLNLGRMDRIRDLDPLDYTVTAEAGCTLLSLREAAEAADRLFALSLGSEGSCTIGGNLATNAGGILTVRYGNARDLVLGLEVVLPDGRVWNGLRRLRKDNTGYDLKQLFIAGEGTLGIITAATLKLFPRPRQRETALVAVPGPRAAVELLGRLRDGTGDALTACELMPRFAVDGARTYLGRDFDPFPAPSPWYLLLELTGGAGSSLREQTEETLAAAIEAGAATDALFAESEERRRRLWGLREGLPEIGRAVGGTIHHDVSVPVSRIPDLIERATEAAQSVVPGCRPYPFGHVADGNIHFNVARPEGMERDAYLAHAGAMGRAVHDVVHALDGSISAEHGIGGRKRAEMARFKDPVELDLMRRVKLALDPEGLMNPGKLLP
ncbi:MAG TPA: FAD-binding oxidoreductase [Azospirillaceae bacterium]|nr:FAD-binding oxidoreductase [Azospirillaceae bacterium]